MNNITQVKCQIGHVDNLDDNCVKYYLHSHCALPSAGQPSISELNSHYLQHVL